MRNFVLKMSRRASWRLVFVLSLLLVAHAAIGQIGSTALSQLDTGATAPPLQWLLPNPFQAARPEPHGAPPYWKPYQWYVVAGVTLLGVETILIAGLLAQRGRRREAEDAVQVREADLRRSHERISDLAGRLITAQEAERARIARELHDDVCQDVAAISVDLSHLRQHAGGVQPHVLEESLNSLQRRTATVAENLRLLSHGLHPSVLHHIGLVAALQAQCAEVERQHRLHVTFFADGEVEPASRLVALSLFRIAQEALRNTAKHARARHATLSLARLDGELMLAIADDGSGFDVIGARQKGGLGLVSIEERARLVQGRVTICSQPRHGTVVDVRVPSAVVDATVAALDQPPGVDRAWADRPLAVGE